MDDDIANAINSLEGDSADSVVPAADLGSLGAEDTNMPPIFRPDDLIAEPKSTETPVIGATVSEEEVPTEVPIDENSVEVNENEAPEQPAAEVPASSLGQTFAPMPQVPTETPPVAVPPVPIGVPREPIRDTYVNPAMVPDPLSEGKQVDSRGMSVAVDGTLIERPTGDASVKTSSISGNKTLKNILLYSGLAVFLIVIVVAGYFGYQAYQASNNLRILQGSLSQISSLPKMSSDLSLSTTGFAIKGKLEVDGDQNVRATITDENLPGSLVYIKKKDALYIADPENSKFSSKKYTEYKNAWKAVTDAKTVGFDVSQLVPQKSWLNASTAKVFTRESNETVNGKRQYRFAFLVSSEMIDALKANLAGNSSGVELKVDESATKAEIWIDATTGRITKIDARAVATVTSSGDAAKNVQGVDMKYTFSWQQSFDYSFNDAIKLPIGARIINSTDAAAAYDENFGTGAENKTKDTALRSDISVLQTALEQYKSDEGAYPAATDINELMAIFTAGDDPYLTSDYNVGSINYEYDVKTGKYKFSFRLNNQNQTGANITGSAPNKVYAVGN